MSGFVDYLRMMMGWWSNVPSNVVIVDFVCVDTVTISKPDAVATIGVPRSSARLHCPKTNAFQRPC